MNNIEQVPLMLTISKEYRDKLRKIAAKINLKNTDQVTSASQIGKEIIYEHLDRLEVTENE